MDWSNTILLPLYWPRLKRKCTLLQRISSLLVGTALLYQVFACQDPKTDTFALVVAPQDTLEYQFWQSESVVNQAYPLADTVLLDTMQQWLSGTLYLFGTAPNALQLTMADSKIAVFFSSGSHDTLRRSFPPQHLTGFDYHAGKDQPSAKDFTLQFLFPLPYGKPLAADKYELSDSIAIRWRQYELLVQRQQNIQIQATKTADIWEVKAAVHWKDSSAQQHFWRRIQFEGTYQSTQQYFQKGSLSAEQYFLQPSTNDKAPILSQSWQEIRYQLKD